ncbi:hypothetical protein NAP1_10688 [Erythrobacter sp. NAP1]|uniref:phasin family protein n=1 Tax=Erythrobacter sp. NAP1 TaxID=237727 RepID=UPI0000687781|nr:phasin family protein [Erythrobacter sp. NAP1]EAQ28055.1 hypothetical protein NAP1_10688 [Erythrobacter sp. NAP1]
MADAANKSKIDAAAEKAYADAAAKKTASAAKVAEAVEADAPKPAPKAKTVKKAVAAKKAPARKAPAKKAPARKTAAKKPAAAKKAPARKTAAKKPVAKKTAPKAAAKTSTTNPVTKLKDTIMATAEKTDITAQAKEMAADVQTRVKGAYAKATELASEAGEFNKANVEAVVESGKIFFAGAQEIVKSDVETGKSVVETVTEDAKKVAAVKSPTELFELQGELARRNFDAAVSFGSKRTEALVKLYNDAFAPISNRVSVATERFNKAA